MIIAKSSVEWIIYYFVPLREKEEMAQSHSMGIGLFNIFTAHALKTNIYSSEKIG